MTVEIRKRDRGEVETRSTRGYDTDISEIYQDPEHSDGAPTIEGTGTRVKDVAVAHEHSGSEPDEITQLYPDRSLGDVHRALACYYDHIDDVRSAESATA